MGKKFWQIVSLIFSVVTLIYIIMVYYGLDRYLLLHVKSTEGYISKYSGIEKDQEKVVVVFDGNTCTNTALKPFLNSLLDQTVRIDDICVCLSTESKKKFPSFVSVQECDKNCNPLSLVVLREMEGDTFLLVLKPDLVYGQDYIAQMLEKARKNPEKVITDGHGGLLLRQRFFSGNVVESCEKGKGGNCVEDWVKNKTKREIIRIEYSPIYGVLFK